MIVFENDAGEDLKLSGGNVFENRRKGDPQYIKTESLTILLPMATGKIENILNKMGALAQEIFCLKCHVEFFWG